MPTTFVFKQPSGVQAFTGTLSSISGIVAAAIPTLINVKSAPSAAPNPASTQAPVAAVQSKAPGSRSGGKTTTAGATAATALSAEETPPPDAADKQATIDLLNNGKKEDTKTITALRQLLITQLKTAGKSNDEINAILIKSDLHQLYPWEL